MDAARAELAAAQVKASAAAAALLEADKRVNELAARLKEAKATVGLWPPDDRVHPCGPLFVTARAVNLHIRMLGGRRIFPQWAAITKWRAAAAQRAANGEIAEMPGVRRHDRQQGLSALDEASCVGRCVPVLAAEGRVDVALMEMRD